MNETKRQLVKANIENIGNDINNLSQIFYRELFYIDIQLKNVFQGNVVFLNRKFSNMLGTFKNVIYLEKISTSVEKMGRRHKQEYAVQLEHFESVRQALIIALKLHFEDQFTTELEEAWNHVFQEVSDIMKASMQKTDNSNIKISSYDASSYDARLLSEVNGEQGIFKVHQRFYDVLFNEPWLEQFFYGKSKEALIDKQTKFMVAAFGGENNYTGDTPAFVHMHMFITEEMLNLRQQILKQAILNEEYGASVAERWLKVDDSFRASIVKSSIDECALKCRGQVPVVAKKPVLYKPLME